MCRWNLTPLDTQLGLIDRSVTIAGGYDSADWLADPDPRAYPTVLDAQGGGRGVPDRLWHNGHANRHDVGAVRLIMAAPSTCPANELTPSEVTIRGQRGDWHRWWHLCSPSSGNSPLTAAYCMTIRPMRGGAPHWRWSGRDHKTAPSAALRRNRRRAPCCSQVVTIVRSATIANNSSLSLTDGLYVTGTVDMARTIVADHAGGDNCTFTSGTLADSGNTCQTTAYMQCRFHDRRRAFGRAERQRWQHADTRTASCQPADAASQLYRNG